jgi:hypothetical protein
LPCIFNVELSLDSDDGFITIFIVSFLWAKLVVHCKKELAVFPSPAGMSLIKLFLGGNNLVFSRPERVWSVTSRLGTGKWLTLCYSVGRRSKVSPFPCTEHLGNTRSLLYLLCSTIELSVVACQAVHLKSPGWGSGISKSFFYGVASTIGFTYEFLSHCLEGDAMD